MPIATRHSGLTATFALLALLAAHASFALHATNHDLVDPTGCELCISYGNTAGAANAATEHGVMPAPEIPAGWDNDTAPTPQRVHLVRPRGPPSAD